MVAQQNRAGAQPRLLEAPGGAVPDAPGGIPPDGLSQEIGPDGLEFRSDRSLHAHAVEPGAGWWGIGIDKTRGAGLAGKICCDGLE